MSITDELRKWAQICGIKYDSKLYEIADTIDTAHRSALEKLAAQVDEGEDGWVRLPLDADGVTIRVGDRLTDGEYTFTVCELATFRDGSWSIRNEDGNAWAACDVTHHALTVEDVLRQFAREIDADAYGITDAKVAEFAAKLRLAGDE